MEFTLKNVRKYPDTLYSVIIDSDFKPAIAVATFNKDIEKYNIKYADIPNYRMGLQLLDVYHDAQNGVIIDDVPNLNGSIIIMLICAAYHEGTDLSDDTVAKIKEMFTIADAQAFYDRYCVIVPIVLNEQLANLDKQIEDQLELMKIEKQIRDLTAQADKLKSKTY